MTRISRGNGECYSIIETVDRPLGASLPEELFDSFGRPVSRFPVWQAHVDCHCLFQKNMLHHLPQLRVQIAVALVLPGRGRARV